MRLCVYIPGPVLGGCWPPIHLAGEFIRAETVASPTFVYLGPENAPSSPLPRLKMRGSPSGLDRQGRVIPVSTPVASPQQTIMPISPGSPYEGLQPPGEQDARGLESLAVPVRPSPPR